jgi:hypothetical protein
MTDVVSTDPGTGTKPGLAFVPAGSGGDAVLTAMACSHLAELPGVETVAQGGEPQGAGFSARPLPLTTTAAERTTAVRGPRPTSSRPRSGPALSAASYVR